MNAFVEFVRLFVSLERNNGFFGCGFHHIVNLTERFVTVARLSFILISVFRIVRET